MVLASLAACKKSDRSDAYGNFEAVEVTVSSQAGGQILYLDLREGDLVKAGDTLGLVDTVDLSLKKQQLEKNLNVMEARLRSIRSQIEVQEQQKRNLMVEKERLDKLFRDGAATQKQMDDMSGNLDLVNRQIEATRVQLEGVFAERAALEIQIGQVAESISKCLIISPADGTVLTKFAEAGEVTTFGKPLFKLADLTQMELKVYISGDQLPYLKIGEKVKVKIDKSASELTELSGTVSWISSTAEFTPKTIQTKEERVNLVYAAKVIVPNDGALKIGMPGEIDFMPVR
jgi:HlyD family secretion protein